MPSFVKTRFLLSIFRLPCSVRSFAKTYIYCDEVGLSVLPFYLGGFHCLVTLVEAIRRTYLISNVCKDGNNREEKDQRNEIAEDAHYDSLQRAELSK